MKEPTNVTPTAPVVEVIPEVKLPTVNGLALFPVSSNLLVHKISEKTKAGSLSIHRQKDFVEAWRKQHPDDSRNKAKHAYQVYRIGVARKVNEGITAKMTSGELLTSRISLSKTGAVRGISFLQERDASSARVTEAAMTFAKEKGWSDEEVQQFLALARAKKKASVNVETTPVPTLTGAPGAEQSPPEHVSQAEPLAASA